MSKATPLTKAFKAGKQTICVVQRGGEFSIYKKVINYVRGKNVESWRVMGSASTFDNLADCLEKFNGLVNASRKADGKPLINLIAGE